MTPDQLARIDAAIAAHGQSITRLHHAIREGTSDFEPAVVAADNACEFGKWLYGAFPSELKGTPAFEAIRQAHAGFHKTAASILTLALQGRKAEALALLEPRGDFMTQSGGLVLKLRALMR